MDVGNIFKSLFRIYKTTKLLMQHHNSLHTNTHINKKIENQQYALTFSFFLSFSFLFSFFLFILQVTLQKHPSSVQIFERRLKHEGSVDSSTLMSTAVAVWNLQDAFISFMKLFSTFTLTMGRGKCAFLTALKSSKSLSSLSVPKAAIRCWWCIFAKSHGPKNMETNGEIDRRGQIDRWRDGGSQMRDERGKTSAFSARPAPLPDLFFPPQRNKSRNRLKAPIPALVAFHPRSSDSVPVPALLWQQERNRKRGKKRKKKKQPTGNEEDRSVFWRVFGALRPAGEVRPLRAETQFCPPRPTVRRDK